MLVRPAHDPKTEPVFDRDHASMKGAGASVSEQMRRFEEEKGEIQ
jgi:hypothetical protein